ncbi:DUF4333 domain-containing protein [Rhodococcus kronopolitis]|uniref:DUF4333 domain-containing protein n=1 Tax=Rhodococcus kronopolitis TaxID=1460226 RepID=A0ABV9FU24_9NOCA
MTGQFEGGSTEDDQQWAQRPDQPQPQPVPVQPAQFPPPQYPGQPLPGQPLPGQQFPPPQFPGAQYPQPQYPQPQYPQQQFPGPFPPPGPYQGQFQPPYPAVPPPPRSATPKWVAIGVVALLAAGGIVAAVLSTRGTTLDQQAAQQGVAQVLADSYGAVEVADVSCPSGQKVVKGANFVCTLTVKGEPQQVTVTFTDGVGTYEVGRPTTP